VGTEFSVSTQKLLAIIVITTTFLFTISLAPLKETDCLRLAMLLFSTTYTKSNMSATGFVGINQWELFIEMVNEVNK
jgi:hypothetical protein